jgi:hypothetical protein
LLSGSASAAVERSNCLTTAYQVDDENHYRNHEQNVDEAAGDMQAEAEKPKDEQDYKYCPEHREFPF